MIRIRGGRGLGDSLYLRPIATYLARTGQQITALSDYPEVFEGSGVPVEPFRRSHATVVAHYISRKSDQRTTQYADMLESARIADPVPLRFGWTVRNVVLVERLQALAAGRPIVLVHGGREPMGRTDGFGLDLMPQQRGFDCALSMLDDCYRIRVGQLPVVYPISVDDDLTGGTSVYDLLDLAWISAGIVAQCSFAVPLAEVFDKPLLAVWSSRGLNSANDFVRTCTPQKILTKPTSRFVLDNWTPAQMRDAVRGFHPMQIAA